MANTTNYNWETPDDTDLVKDGAAAIRTLGSSIDTTTKNLNPETTTGDIAYRSATANTNTRLAIGSTGQVLTVAAGVPSWATPTVGDITEVQAGVGISVASGTGPIPVITNSSTDLITTAGDLLYGTAADTVARLGIGTAGQVLKVNSGATAPEWGAAAGGGFVGCSVYDSNATQSIATGTDTVVTFDSEFFDTDGFHSTSSNTGRITIPSGKDGKYLFIASSFFSGITATSKEGRFYKNGSQVFTFGWSIAGGSSGTPCVAIMNLVATDYVEFRVVQNTGGNANLYKSGGGAGEYAFFACQYLGA
jgi:hypothetical protein